jgi:hypothetical protein
MVMRKVDLWASRLAISYTSVVSFTFNGIKGATLP